MPADPAAAKGLIPETRTSLDKDVVADGISKPSPPRDLGPQQSLKGWMTRQRWPSLHNLEYVILFMKTLKINKVRSTKKVSMNHKPVLTVSICSHQRV
ncbi:hypothetical protein U0070_020374 [Myodes glareolus]|uniref:Uncharacterized protein n=1 Tax=Myodes glareolus TaxID=447135 RepID=A0AAW0JVW9_MYOGA